MIPNKFWMCSDDIPPGSTAWGCMFEPSKKFTKIKSDIKPIKGIVTPDNTFMVLDEDNKPNYTKEYHLHTEICVFTTEEKATEMYNHMVIDVAEEQITMARRTMRNFIPASWSKPMTTKDRVMRIVDCMPNEEP
ncbi:MAG: hypothetical protein HDQ88_05110, partial [Clostridia bacterium]|nr:hypothetical protein [Clostridia bacterium]